MMKITAIELNDAGKCVSMKGYMVNNRQYFNILTNKIIYWVELEIDYAGG